MRMRIVIAGGHGQVALRLERLLHARGDEVAGIIRKPEQWDDLLAAGAEPVVCDLESASVADVARHLEGADAAVFAAGAGPGSGEARKDTVDRAACALFADAAEAAGVRRFVVVSAMGADRKPPAGTDPVFAAYLRAKGAADALVVVDHHALVEKGHHRVDHDQAGVGANDGLLEQVDTDGQAERHVGLVVRVPGEDVLEVRAEGR